MTSGRPPAIVHDGACPRSLADCARARDWSIRTIGSPADRDPTGRDEDVALVVAGPGNADAWRRRYPNALLATSANDCREFDLHVVDDAPASAWHALLGLALRCRDDRALALTGSRELRRRDDRLQQLTEIGRALSRERDPARLLELILSEGRRIAGCDAGSLYLIDAESAAPCLVFKLAQNDSVDVALHEARLPLAPSSLSGYVATTGRELNIPDAYAIAPDATYGFNRAFDETTGYRTQSLLVLPMRDHRGDVIGVLQFINRMVDGAIVAFDDEVAQLLDAVASLAAVAIQKNQLIRDVSNLFESFVQASVKAIEQRDPSTSGHSSRVAHYTTALFEALPRSGRARFRDLAISETGLTELRYAALLHDFGKVGVRESILVKANKLSDERLEVIRYRFELQKERLRRAALEEELKLLHDDAKDFIVARKRIKRKLADDIVRLDEYFSQLTLANNPNVLAVGDYTHLAEIRAEPFVEFDGRSEGLIADTDLHALSVRKGSLTPLERKEIERHVVFTRDFLAVLPWPPELSRVPLIAAAHHEKLDGSGYPLGLVGEQIPLPSRVMAVCDIFDALTAMDRPYKPALPVDRALKILEDEATSGLLDAEIVSIFIESAIHRSVVPPSRHAEERSPRIVQ